MGLPLEYVVGLVVTACLELDVCCPDVGAPCQGGLVSMPVVGARIGVTVPAQWGSHRGGRWPPSMHAGLHCLGNPAGCNKLGTVSRRMP